MNEININIEGYNVNGICVGCLNYNRKMFFSKELKECFKTLGNIEIPDGLTVQVCWECMAAVRYVRRFQTQILDAFEVLAEYSKLNTFLNSPNDLAKHASQRLSTVVTSEPVYLINEEDRIKDSETIDSLKPDPFKVEVQEDIKEEPESDMKFEHIDLEINDTKVPVKAEAPALPLFLDSSSEAEIFDDFPEQFDDDHRPSEPDDDDIRLSNLKKKKDMKKDRKKEHREKKRKAKVKEDKRRKKMQRMGAVARTKDSKERRALQLKNYRKLKNLPEDIVELFDMSDAEMFAIRKEDVVNTDFTKIRYKCDDCIIGFNTEKLMLDHMENKHKPKDANGHHCDVCRAYFLTADNVSVHRVLHLVGYRCRPCGFRTGLKHLMMRHVKAEHREREDRPLDEWPCTICSKVFSTKSKLSYHRGISHQERPQCDCCGKVFANKMTLKYHLKILPYDKTDKPPKEKMYLPCKGCSKVFYSRKSYRAHVVIHDGLEYPCPICGKLFQWKRNLARHIRNHRERDTGTFYDCKECGKRFSSKDCFNNHMKFSKKHVSEETYSHECSFCGKKFPTKWCMIDHMDWDHLKKIKYQCQVCLKAFKTAKIMVAHMNNIHEGRKNMEPEGEHLCEVCGKSYKTVKRLKGHVWAMHTHRSTAKSFKCKLCPATFTWQTSIYKHMKMMHENPKRSKQQSRPLPPPKKIRDERVELPYHTIELSNRGLHFYQHDVANNLTQNGVQNVQSHGIVSNIVV